MQITTEPASDLTPAERAIERWTPRQPHTHWHPDLLAGMQQLVRRLGPPSANTARRDLSSLGALANFVGPTTELPAVLTELNVARFSNAARLGQLDLAPKAAATYTSRLRALLDVQEGRQRPPAPPRSLSISPPYRPPQLTSALTDGVPRHVRLALLAGVAAGLVGIAAEHGHFEPSTGPTSWVFVTEAGHVHPVLDAYRDHIAKVAHRSVPRRSWEALRRRHPEITRDRLRSTWLEALRGRSPQELCTTWVMGRRELDHLALLEPAVTTDQTRLHLRG